MDRRNKTKPYNIKFINMLSISLLNPFIDYFINIFFHYQYYSLIDKYFLLMLERIMVMMFNVKPRWMYAQQPLWNNICRL